MKFQLNLKVNLQPFWYSSSCFFQSAAVFKGRSSLHRISPWEQEVCLLNFLVLSPLRLSHLPFAKRFTTNYLGETMEEGQHFSSIPWPGQTSLVDLSTLCHWILTQPHQLAPAPDQFGCTNGVFIAHLGRHKWLHGNRCCILFAYFF